MKHNFFRLPPIDVDYLFVGYPGRKGTVHRRRTVGNMLLRLLYDLPYPVW